MALLSHKEPTVTEMLAIGALGGSLIYLLLGGGVFGAVVIFILLRMFGR